MECYICGETDLIEILNLGHHPPSDAFLDAHALREAETTYPLDLLFCPSCALVQLSYSVDPEVLFREYVYTTGSNASLRASFASLARETVARFDLRPSDLVVDIGSNDGTLLRAFASHGPRIVGVDPSSVGRAANDAGVTTVNEFFSAKVAEQLRDEHGAAAVVTSTNTFAHVPDLSGFMEGINLLLAPEGVFISESHHLLSLVEGLQYDSIYHEHLRYYSVGPLRELFRRFGMEILDVELISTHGGSIRVYAARRGLHPVQRSVQEVLDREEKAGLRKRETLEPFAARVHAHKRSMLAMVTELRAAGSRIMGIGAPAKGNTLLNFCRLDADLIECLVETSDLKIGLFAPGSHIVVREERVLLEEQPGFGLVLSWNIADALLPKLRRRGFRGRFILPFPTVRLD